MSSFVNTIDVLGDNVVLRMILERTITELKDNVLVKTENYLFIKCSELTIVDLPNVTSIGDFSFYQCAKLTSVILRSTTICRLSNTNAFTYSPIYSGSGYIYVPSSLVDTYKSASNWSAFASQFRALEDYTVDGTITGELDPTKI